MSQQSFADLGVSDAVARALAARGVTAPFEVQRSVVPDVLAGHDVLVQSPTGSGKTLAFGVPLVDIVQAEDARAAALVLVPTRELAGQVADELRDLAAAGSATLAAIDDEAWKSPAPAGILPTLGDGVEALWYDAWLHADDIRAAAGLPAERSAGLRASVIHLAALLEAGGWGPATLALDGVEEVPVGSGSGRRVTGDPHQFVLVATGRADPATLGLDETANVYR